MANDIQAVQEVVSRLHQAYTALDVEAALRCYGGGLFRAVQKEGKLSDPTRWEAGSFRTHEELRLWVTQVVSQPNIRYKVDFQFVHTHIGHNAAVVLTKETGLASDGNTEGTWKDYTNMWCLVKEEGTWKVVGTIANVDGTGKSSGIE
jgi:hypothetical protein